MATFICLEDFEEEAKKRLDAGSWSYYSSGSAQEFTLRDNIQAYSRYLIRPRVLHDVSSVDLTTTVQGETIPFPVCVSPTAQHSMVHHDREMATAKACQKMNTCMIVSTWATTPLEEVGNHCEGGGGLRWFQVQPLTVTKNFVRRAEAAGYKAIVVTVDHPVTTKKLTVAKVNEQLRTLSLANFNLSQNERKAVKTANYYIPESNWTYIDELRSITSLPIILKGILRPDDAMEAVKHNIQGIIVSNHGGRLVDTVPATIDALPGVVDAVRGSGIEVYVDGGIRHGTDVLKALALGARAVFIGRPVIHGLACNGEEGVCQVLEILKEEVRQAFSLSGCRNIKEVQSVKNLVVHKSFYSRL